MLYFLKDIEIMWVIFGIITSIFAAAYYLLNQKSHLKTEVFIVYRGFLVALITTPLALFYFHIFPWQFYAITLFQGIAISYLDYKYFNLYHEFGAENVNAIDPLRIFIVFILWLILKPAMINTYLEMPLRFFIIIASIIMMIFSVIQYSHQKIGKNCLKAMIPILVIAAIVDISNKFVMEYHEGYLLSLTIHRIFLTGWIIGCINLLLNHKKNLSYSELININNIKKSWFIILIVLNMIFLNFSMYYTPNPAYISAICLLSVIWIVMINKIMIFFGKNASYTYINLKWILLLLFSSIVFIIASQS